MCCRRPSGTQLTQTVRGAKLPPPTEPPHFVFCGFACGHCNCRIQVHGFRTRQRGGSPPIADWCGWEKIGRRTPAVGNQMRFNLPSDDVRNSITQLGRTLNGLVIAPLLPGVLPAGCWLEKTSQRLVAAVTVNLSRSGGPKSKENRPPSFGPPGQGTGPTGPRPAL